MGEISGDVNSAPMLTANAADLSSRATAGLRNGDSAYVVSKAGTVEGPFFFIDKSSVLPIDGVGVLATDSAVGRWLSKALYSGGVTSSAVQLGRVAVVDQIYGDDATGALSGNPFLTISAALTAASAVAGSLVWIMPGEYNESIVIPDNVAIRGCSKRSVTIQRLGVTADTDLVTMGESSRLEDVTLRLTSAGHHTLRGLVFSGTTSETASVLHVDLFIDNSGAAIGGTSAVTGAASIGTGVPDDSISALEHVLLNVASTGLGDKRGVLVSTVSTFNTIACGIHVSRAGGAGSFIGGETTNAGAVWRDSSSRVEGFTADISQTTGTIRVGGTELINSNANGLGFTTDLGGYMRTFCDPGGIAGAAAKYMYPGTFNASATNETQSRIYKSRVIKSISVRAINAPGGVLTDTWTVRKNGVDTGVSVSLTGVNTSNTSSNVSVTFAAGDRLSVKQQSTAGSNCTGPVVDVEIY